MTTEELEKAIFEAFQKNNREGYRSLSNRLEQEMLEIEKEQKALSSSSEFAEKQKLLKERYDKFSVVNGFMYNQVDLLTYKSLYEIVVTVIEQFRQNDAKGYESFEKTLRELGLDISFQALEEE